MVIVFLSELSVFADSAIFAPGVGAYQIPVQDQRKETIEFWKRLILGGYGITRPVIGESRIIIKKAPHKS